jgi:hypothetical protein
VTDITDQTNDPLRDHLGQTITSQETGTTVKIRIRDSSTKINSTQIATAVTTMNMQLAQFSKLWFGPDHYCYANPSTWDWEILVVDAADVADALGYHDVSPEGKPYGKVFIDVCQKFNVPWISVLSHEVLELVLDPGANQWAHDPTGKLWAYEACDAVQDHLYTLNGQQVSNFVLPNFFIPGSKPPYDYLGKLTKPFSVNKGYSIVGQITQVSQIFGMIKRDTTATTIEGDRKGLEAAKRPDKQHPAARTQRRLHSFD